MSEYLSTDIVIDENFNPIEFLDEYPFLKEYWKNFDPKEQRTKEREFISELTALSFSKPDIFRIMKSSPMGYWSNSDTNYKDDTYSLAYIDSYKPDPKTFQDIQSEIFLYFYGDSKNKVPKSTAKAHHIIKRRILEKLRFMTNEATDQISYYIDGIYQTKADYLIKKYVELALEDGYTPYSGREIVELIKISTNLPSFVTTMYPDLICLQNGVRDVKTGDFMPHSPDFYLVEKVPVTFDKNAKCPTITQFIYDILPDKDPEKLDEDGKPIQYPKNKKYRKTLIELVGYCLLRKYPIHRIFVLQGEGRNGKSTFLELLSRFLGHHNIANVEMEELNGQFSNADLVGKLANISDDLPDTALYKSGKIKALTGGKEYFRINAKGEKPYQGKIYAKHIFACNDVPRIYDNSNAIFDRFNGSLIKFLQRFAKDNPKTDINLLDKLTTTEELSGLLNLALDSLTKLLKNKTFSSSESFEESKKNNLLHINPIQLFGQEMITIITEYTGEIQHITKNRMYQIYCRWCQYYKIVPVSKQKLSRELEQKFSLQSDKNQHGRIWVAVQLKSLEKLIDRKKKTINIGKIVHESIDELSPIAIEIEDIIIDFLQNNINGHRGIEKSPIIEKINEMGDYKEIDIEDVLFHMQFSGKILSPYPDRYKLVI